MQAMPTIPADPINSGQPAESKPAVNDVSSGQFSQHLATASQGIDSPARDSALPTSADNDLSRPDDSNANEIPSSILAVGDLQLALVAPQNQQGSQPVLIMNSQQDTQLLALLNSIEVHDTTSQQTTPKNQPTPLESILDITRISGNEQTASTVSIPSSGQTASTVSTSFSGQTPSVITVENWRAQFSYQSSANVQGAHNPQSGAGQAQHTGQGTLQEPVLAYTSPEIDNNSPSTHPSRGSGIDFPNQPRDANSNYIHSNLPGVNLKTDGAESKNSPQQNDDGQKNMAQDTLSQQELATTAKSSQDTPLIFTLDQDKASGLMPQTQTTSTSLMLKLPSGTEVPQSHIMNQVIDRFTLNRTLESGTITLKLYPEELGELRMEIKVEQDNIKAHITTQNPQVQEILDRYLPRLREALEQQGLNLEQMKVTVAADDDSRGQLFQDHFDGQQPKRSQRSNSDQLAFSLDQTPQDEGEGKDKQQNLSVLA